MDKETIISEIKRTAILNKGVALGKAKFFQETGIKESDWYGRFWVKWSDAVNEAGFMPNVFVTALDEKYLLERITELIAEIGGFPTAGHLKLKANSDETFPDNKVFYKRFGNKDGLINAVKQYCLDNELNEILSLLPSADRTDNERVSDPKLVTLGFVYLYKSQKYYKIGRTNNSTRRDREIKLQLPFQASLIHQISTDDPIGIERYWHQRFADKRLNGEWFELSTEDVKAFKRRKFM